MQSARGFEYGVRHIISPQSGLLSDVLFSTSALERPEVEFLLDLGSVYLNHRRVTENSSVLTGDYIRVHTKPRRFPVDDKNWHSRIIFANEHFVVANKISALPVHASVDNIRENMHAYLEAALGLPLFVTHRLDVPTRGLIVFAKTSAFQIAFNKLLAHRETQKIYRARVEGCGLKTGFLQHYMEPSPRAPKTVSSLAHPQWQECLLNILRVQAVDENSSEVLIELHTGRTHQIRAQLSHEKHPILGDHAYGAKKIYVDERIDLEACELKFTDPVTGQKYHLCLP